MKTIAEQLNIKEFPFKINDHDGNIIYYETPNRYWSKREYDSNGNQTHYETSNGFWENREYDSNGNLIYYKDSNGLFEDNRPKSTCEGKIVEIDGVKYELKEVKQP
jgi:lactam utilization protein B